MPPFGAATAEELAEEEYRPVVQMVKDNERAHQNLRRVVLHTIAQNLVGDGDRQLAVDLLHAYNGMPKIG